MLNYEQVRVLGQGGYGKAVLAKRKSDGFLVCIKEIRLNQLSAKDKEEAQKEIKVLASLNHPYIVKYIESFQERGTLHIVMEYADGGDLSQKIERSGKGLMKESDILKDFIQIALAIKYIHDRKILHRDLKGQNIFLLKDGTIKLGDFGIARVLDHTMQVCRTQIGTPYYLSPEICQGRNYNSKTDIWSLGCILYELCTLKHAFEAPNMNALLMNIIKGKFTPISSNYSQEIRDLVDRMLVKEPEKRPSINQILTLPFIKGQLELFLSKTLLGYEMDHTVIHGRKAFAHPTIVPKALIMPEEERNNEKEDRRRAFIEQENKRGEKKERERKRIENENLEKKRCELEQMNKEIKKKQDEYEERNNILKKNQERARGGGVIAQIENEERPSSRERQLNREEIYNIENKRAGFAKKKAEENYRPANDQQKGAIDNDERRKLWEEQRKEAKANRERMKLLELGGGDLKEAINDSDNDPKIQKGNAVNAKHEIDNDERRKLWEEQRKEAKANRERMKLLELGGGDLKEAINVSDNNISDVQTNEKNPNGINFQKEEFKDFYRKQREEMKANKRKALENENDIELLAQFENELNEHNINPKSKKRPSQIIQRRFSPKFVNDQKENQPLKPDFGQALSGRTSKLFIESRDDVLKEIIDTDNDEECSPQIKACSDIIEEALSIPDIDQSIDDQFEAVGDQEGSINLSEGRVVFPVARDSESLSYRAESIRSFLEKRIGCEIMLKITQEMESQSNNDLMNIIGDKEPGIIVLVQQLLIIEGKLK